MHTHKMKEIWPDQFRRCKCGYFEWWWDCRKEWLIEAPYDAFEEVAMVVKPRLVFAGQNANEWSPDRYQSTLRRRVTRRFRDFCGKSK